MGFLAFKIFCFMLAVVFTTESPAEQQRSLTDTRVAPGTTVQNLQTIEATTKEILDHINAATVSIRSGYGGGSGAIIREDGLILTAAHVAGVPDEDLMVTLADSRIVRARVLGCDHDKDIALAIIIDEGRYPFVELADTTTPGQWCLAMGHPGGLHPGRSAVLRVSRVSEQDLMDNAGLGISSTASLINGDSGGPLFDLQGRLIGVHRAVNPMDAERSYHAPVDWVHERMQSLLDRQEFGISIMKHFDIAESQANHQIAKNTDANDTGSDSKTEVDMSQLPEHIRDLIESGEAQLVKSSSAVKEDTPKISESKAKSSQTRRVLQFKVDPNEPGITQDLIRERLEEMGISHEKIVMSSTGSQTSNPNQDLFDSVTSTANLSNKSTVRVLSDGKPAAMGVIVDKNGFLVSKASVLTGSVSVLLDGEQYVAGIVAVDEPNDLVLLKINANNLLPIVWAQDDTPEVGTFVIAPGSTDVAGFGVLSHGNMAQRKTPDFSATELLGLKIKRGQRFTQIESVHDGGPAQLAGLEAGDLIVAVNGIPISNGASFLISLQGKNRGSNVNLTRLTPDGRVFHSDLQFNTDHLDSSISGLHARETLRIVSEMAALVSTRSLDFPLTFLHDTALKASDCGGPLIDLEGRVIGLNIARLDRTSTVAIPALHAAMVIERLLDESR